MFFSINLDRVFFYRLLLIQFFSNQKRMKDCASFVHFGKTCFGFFSHNWQKMQHPTKKIFQFRKTPNTFHCICHCVGHDKISCYFYKAVAWAGNEIEPNTWTIWVNITHSKIFKKCEHNNNLTVNASANMTTPWKLFTCEGNKGCCTEQSHFWISKKIQRF